MHECDPSCEPRGSPHAPRGRCPRSVRHVPLTGGLPGQQEVLFQELGERIRDVRAGPEGAIYLLTDSPDGRVLRVLPAS